MLTIRSGHSVVIRDALFLWPTPYTYTLARGITICTAAAVVVGNNDMTLLAKF